MKIECVDGNVIRVYGDVTMHTSAQIKKDGQSFIEASSNKEWIVDLSGAIRVDSSALALMLSWLRCAKRCGSELVFHSMPLALISLAGVCDVDSILSVASKTNTKSV